MSREPQSPVTEGWVDIAVIGMSGLFPAATSLEQFYANLRAGRDGVGDMPTVRRTNSSLPHGRRALSAGYLERVDLFDYRHFGLSRREAELMDPQQRLLLELVCTAIEDAGYRVQDLAGTGTALTVASRYSDYFLLVPERHDPMLMTGNLPGMAAGRISYLLDVHGPSLTLDTGCSSSLLAILDACRRLVHGESELAIAGSVNVINRFSDEDSGGRDIGIGSRDGKCRPFDARASGTVSGEGGGVLVLKRLAQALRDGDEVRAVIKGGATNHDGRRSGGLTAPSDEAQTEVIRRALAVARVPAASIDYVEAHGTGTAIGDPIEYKALRQALASEPRARALAIGSVKSNIGHLDSAAGMAGAIKTILSLQKRELLPSLHFERLNPLIERGAGDPIRVQATLAPWEPAGSPRRAGVSSFSLTGSNVHLVLEEAPARPPATQSLPEPLLFKLSARTPESLRRYGAAVRAHLLATSAPLSDVAHTLAVGRGDYEQRLAFVACERDESVAELDRQLATLDQKAASGGRPVVLLLPARPLSDATLASWRQDASFAATMMEGGDLGRLSDGARTVLQQVALHRLLLAQGVSVRSVVGAGVGRLAKQVIVDGLPLADALGRADTATWEPPAADKLAALARELEQSAALVVEAAADAALSAQLARLGPQPRRWTLIPLFDVPRLPLTAVAALYAAGADIDWRRLAGTNERADALRRRVAAPTYAFERTRCWYAEPTPPPGAEDVISAPPPRAATLAAPPVAASPASPSEASWTPTESRVCALWQAVLGPDPLDRDESFFEVGGHSINGVQLIELIESEWGVTVDLETFFADATVRALARCIDERRRGPTVPALPPLERRGDGDTFPLSHAQGRLWILDQLYPGSAAYNVPELFMLRGVDVELLQRVLTALVARHESLRTIFVSTSDGPRQRILPTLPVDLADVDLHAVPDPDEPLRQLLQAQAAQPFQLDRGPLFRAAVYRLPDERALLALTLHHIITDGWSMRVLMREMALLYRALRAGVACTLPELPVAYRDYAQWHNELLQGGALTAARDYWHATLADAPTAVRLPRDFHPANPGDAGKLLAFTLGDVTPGLRRLAVEHDTTVYVVLMSVVALFLHKLAGQEDIVIGTDMAGRIHPALAEVVGFFVNTIVLRQKIDPQARFTELLAQTKQRVVEAHDRQSYPFDRLTAELSPRRQSRTPLFNVMVSYQGHKVEPGSAVVDALAVARVELGLPTSRFEWELQLNDQGDDIAVEVTYNPSLFRQQTMELHFVRFEMLLREVVANPRQRIADVHGYLATQLGGAGQGLEEEGF